MDKNEYKIKADEIKALIAQAEYQQAAEIADSIDWRRVKSVMMLCTISDLYKINRRYEDSRDILLLAYDRHPGGRTIVYSLCELSIKIEDYVMAIEYYKEFVQIAPKDTGRYILQYKLYQAQDVSLEERIAVLEELKAKDYREKWAYELAYLYHRVGLATKCIEECDELILWFGEGKYVVKAMELKMLHQPLTSEQQGKYDDRFQPEPFYEDSESFYQDQEPGYEDGQGREYYSEAAYAAEQSVSQEEKAAPPVNVLTAPTIRIPSDEIEIQVKTMDVGEYNTINLQRELAEGLREVLGDEESQDAITRSIIAPMMEDDADGQDVLPDETAQEGGYAGEAAEEQMETEVFFGATGEIGSMGQTEVSVTPQEILAEEEVYTEELPTEIAEAQPEEELPEEELLAEEPPGEKEIAAPPEDQTAAIVMEQLRLQNMGIEPPKEMAGVLSMESDGQISLVVPETERVEKQITGQMRIEDILAEWERMKRDNEEKRKEEIHQKVLRQTGPMFTAFEESIRDGLLEKLEQGVEPEQIVQEAEDVPEEEELLSGEETAADEDTVEELEEIEEEPAEELPEDELEEEIYEEETAEEESVEEYTEEETSEEESVEEYAEEETAEEESAGEYTEEETAEEEPVEEYPEEETTEKEPVEEETAEEETAEEETAEEETAEEAPAEEEYSDEETAEEEPAGEESHEEETDREPVQESVEETPDSKEPQEHEIKPRVRTLSKEEKELFGSFIQSKSSKEQLIAAIDTISLASYTGNVIITGDEGMDTLTLAKNMIREVQMTDSNFSGKIAKISGSSLNRRDIAQTLDSLANGALIIQKASDMSMNTVETLYKALQQEQYGLIVIMEDTRKAMNKFLGVYTKLAECFNARMDMEALSNDSLVAFGKKYAREREYSIDELGILALHTRIAEMQTSDHAVTIMDVKEILDEAILHADRKSMGHFFDILLAKRYDEEDMIILRENDFIK
ncbi:MAG: hypothetical protein HDR02_01095 [Lachnospiraceae bacterium]|nr:hypothetical protein [Lachnospiraceae bacterium]